MRISDWSSDVCSSDLQGGPESSCWQKGRPGLKPPCPPTNKPPQSYLKLYEERKRDRVKASPKNLLATLRGVRQERPPLWLMRQAGRYLPEYRALRETKGGFLELCYDPEAAAEVTLQPIRRFGFDGSLLFKSEGRRVGKGCVMTCKFWWWPYQ